MRTLLLSFLFSTAILIVKAQPPCAGPGRSAGSASAVCGLLTFRETDVSNCTGPDIPNPTSGCGQVTSDNSRWYKFHCYGSGTLGFLITPANPGDDYDWEVMDITGFQPGDVYTTELRVSLNLSGQTGITGCTAAGVSDINCGGGAPGTQYNRFINLLAGHDYLMMVNNWSSSGMPYTIDFSGTAVLNNNQPPTITSVGIVGCDATKLRVDFSEDILCSSIVQTGGGYEFTVTNGTHVITGITSDCLLGANGVPYVIVNLQSPIPAGNYQLNVANGSDGNTLENVCKIAMIPVSVPFTITLVQTPPVIQSVTVDPCHRDKVVVNFDKPVSCASISAAGTELNISPGAWTVNSITYNCTNNQYTTQITMNLASPLPGGNYNVLIADGSDNTTLSDTCSAFMPVGYTFPFVVVPPPAPLIQSFTYDNCKRDKLVVIFDKPILCSTIAADGSDFLIQNGPAITSISTNCGSNAYVTQVTLNIATPMPPLQFLNIMILQGTDNNTLADTCYSFITQFYTNNFAAPPAPPRPVVDSMQYDRCSASFFKVFYSRPILCSSISADGSQYVFVPAPGQVTIVSATPDPATCSQGYTNWVLVQFATPLTVANTRILWHATGSDGKNLRDTCNSTPPLGLPFLNVLGKPSAVFNSQVNWGCVNDDIVLSHPGGNGITSWNWTFSDGRTATGQNVSMSFPVATPTVTVQLIVSNGSCSDTTSQTITLGNVFNAAFTSSMGDTTCINTPINFIDASTGNITNYLWNFGDATQFNGQVPPAHVYPVSNIYNVQLIVTDNHGCRDTASRLMHIDASALIDFTGLKPQYCTGNTVTLKRKISRNVISYVWDNGDGKTFTNEVDVNFSYANEGVYTITLSGVDRYCGPASISKTVPVYAIPKVNLGPDTVLCGESRILIGVPPQPGYTYMWSTGETTPQINTLAFFNMDYALTVDNHGCRGYDAMHVKNLTFCLIRVPNAFTPNRDGLNDELKPLNADLAKDYSFKIYNRVGQLVFASNNPLEGWDGKFKGNPADGGAYVWTLSYIDPWTGKAVKEKGTSILIR